MIILLSACATTPEEKQPVNKTISSEQAADFDIVKIMENATLNGKKIPIKCKISDLGDYIFDSSPGIKMNPEAEDPACYMYSVRYNKLEKTLYNNIGVSLLDCNKDEKEFKDKQICVLSITEGSDNEFVIDGIGVESTSKEIIARLGKPTQHTKEKSSEMLIYGDEKLGVYFTVGEEVINQIVLVYYDLDELSGKGDSASTQEEADKSGLKYDYQVGYDLKKPLLFSDEISKAGGTRVGTMHALPSKIEMELLKQEMKKDKSLADKFKENEIELKEFLEKKYNKKFSLEPCFYPGSLYGRFYFIVTTDSNPGYEFIAISTEQIRQKLFRDYYLSKEHEERIVKKNLTKIKDILGNDTYIRLVYIEEPGRDFVYICNFKTGEVNKLEEQKKIIKLWGLLEPEISNGSMYCGVVYLEPKYENMIKEKYESTNQKDVSSLFNQDTLDNLRNNNEIKDYFILTSGYSGKNAKEIKEEIKRAPQEKQLPYWNKTILK